MPASANVITDAKAMLTNGQTALTAAASQLASNPIQDVIGNLNIYLVKLQECQALLTQIKKVTDASDPNLTYINNALITLS